MAQPEANDLRSAESQYEAQVQKFIQAHPELSPAYTTVSGLPVKRLYGPSDIEAQDYLKDIGFPGQYPYTRGSSLDGYRTRAWKLQPLVGFNTCEETNARWRYLISQGATGLVLDGGPPTSCEGIDRGQTCYESDDERAEGYGHCGLAIETLADWKTLFEGVDPSTVNMNLLSHQSVQLAMYLALAEERQIDKSKLRGTHEAITYGLSDGEEDRREQLDEIEYCVKNLPLWNVTTFKARNIRDGGCTAPQEIAINLAMAVDAARALAEERGLAVDQVAPKFGFMFCCHMDFLEEVAKLRAARRMWARISKEYLSSKDPRSQILRFHVQTAGSVLTREQPLNNIARAAIQGLAAIMGGAQSLHLCPMDEAYTIPTEFSTLLSLRVQQILAHETGVMSVCDPMGGSYCIETLTNQLEEQAQEFLNEIEKRGGECKARSWIIGQVNSSAYEYRKKIESGERIIVGVNEFKEGDYTYPFPLTEYSRVAAEKRVSNLQRVREERDSSKVEAAKEKLTRAFGSKENIIPHMVEAARANLSAGEIHKCRVAAVGERACYSEVCYER
ncbi:MAG: methylmalonyl-CoA mutase [Chloroflexota bacterium]|nr:MAG: methylmalonyl-CoA mutase [Chloroflexota bacterium]